MHSYQHQRARFTITGAALFGTVLVASLLAGNYHGHQTAEAYQQRPVTSAAHRAVVSLLPPSPLVALGATVSSSKPQPSTPPPAVPAPQIVTDAPPAVAPAPSSNEQGSAATNSVSLRAGGSPPAVPPADDQQAAPVSSSVIVKPPTYPSDSKQTCGFNPRPVPGPVGHGPLQPDYCVYYAD